MNRRLSLVILILALCLLLCGGFIWLRLRSPVTSGPFVRDVAPSFLWNEGSVMVNLTLDSTYLPSCTQEQRSADIVLLLDRSDSMEGEPFTLALNAGEEFLKSVDLTRNSVAIAVFDTDAVVVQHLTDDIQALRQSLSAQSVGGGTDIKRALEVAEQELQGMGHRLTAQSFIILLSDGGTEDKVGTIAVAQRLRNEGIRVMTVSLPGYNLEKELMGAIAYSTHEYHPSPSPENLEAIYASLAKVISSGIASDLQMRESLNFEDFTVETSSVTPAAEIQGDAIVWQQAVLSAETNVFSYTLLTNGYGFHTISPIAGSAALVNCQGSLQEWSLPIGPSVLVVPPLLPILCLVPLLLIPVIAFAFWRRRKPPPPPRDEPTRNSSTTGKSGHVSLASDEPPAWLKRLGDPKLALASSAVDIEESARLQNTIIIGCGPAGRQVLSDIAKTLRSRFGNRLPVNVRLLQIDVHIKNTRGDVPICPDGLDPDQWVLLQPNLEEVERNLRENPGDWQHWDWYAQTAPTYERSRGRMSVFYDLRNGSRNSELWPALGRAFADLASPVVRLVGTTFDDVSSGMLVDVARLCQIVTGRSIDVQFWLAGPMDVSWSQRLHDGRLTVRVDDQRSRSLATMRELERLEQNIKTPFIYVPKTSKQSELRETAGGIVQSLFLFQPKYSEVGPENDALPCMADSLLALLYVDANSVFTQHLATNLPIAGSLINNHGQGVICALGGYAIRTPGQSLQKALAWRMVRDMLFDRAVGVAPFETCTTTGSHSPIDYPMAAGSAVTVDIQHDVERFVERFFRSQYGLGSPAFASALERRVAELLNGANGIDSSALTRSNGLAQTTRWLKSIRPLLLRAGERQMAARIEGLIREIENWTEWFTTNVYEETCAKHEEARRTLQRLLEQPARGWTIDKKELEWHAYHKHIRSWLSKPSSEIDEPLLRAGARFGWDVERTEDGKWIVQFIAPPPDFVMSNQTKLDEFTVHYTESPDALLNRVYAVALPFTRQPAHDGSVLDSARNFAAEDWLKYAGYRLDYNESKASMEMGQIDHAAILVGPASGLNDLKTTLDAVPNSPDIHDVATSDPTSLTLMQITNWIPLATTKLYNTDAWRLPVVPTLYVHRAEQLIANVEAGEFRLSSRFVNLLAVDAKLVKLIGLGYLYGVIVKKDDGWDVPGSDIISKAGIGATVETAVNRSSTWEREKMSLVLVDAIEKRKQDLGSQRRTYLRSAKQKKVQPLLNSKEVKDVNFGRYVAGLIKTESGH